MSDAPASAPARKLTKKEKKAQAFRASKASKAKKNAPSFDDEVQAIDDAQHLALDALERAPPAEPVSKKRRRDDDPDTESKVDRKDQADEGAAVDGEQPKNKKRQRGKTQAQRDREAREAAKAAAGGGDGAHRLLLFVGNMPYKVTVDEIKEHFKPCGEVPTVRLLTPKTAPSSTTPSSSSSAAAPPSKGCAFLEFTSGTALQSALRLHHSTLLNRKINVELTAGGGGNSAARKAKIDEQRKKLTLEREKAAKNKRLREGESETGDKTGRWKLAAEKKAAAAAGDGADGAETPATTVSAVVEGALAEKPKKKVRDRRQKDGGAAQAAQAAQQKQKLEARAVKASSGANAIKIASGWGGREKV
ncbi:hypothetical protein JCM3770_000591 [Rhodotorula araucariae]